MNFQVEISYLIEIMTYPFLRSLPPSPALIFLFLILLLEEDGGSPIVLGWGLVLGADLSYYYMGAQKRHIKGFVLVIYFGIFEPASRK